MNRPLLSILSIILVSAIACSKGDEGLSTHSHRIYTENGITISATRGGPKFEGVLFHYEEVLRFQQDESVVESLLTQPRIVLMDQEGAFYVEDGQVNRIARYHYCPVKRH